ncbi:uncharacterized protein DNG_06131 [Cephalotrichum gorgonifer]|uniref:Uncharacterized protein n=1 Tax=Cephalotrichum gorgonifer TaxID=2041049 RepID=A0AAE8SW89_9PEZI|nr:uncharacterized protein DNG_06131 [Cephalotrichum gorgonifer]
MVEAPLPSTSRSGADADETTPLLSGDTEVLPDAAERDPPEGQTDAPPRRPNSWGLIGASWILLAASCITLLLLVATYAIAIVARPEGFWLPWQLDESGKLALLVSFVSICLASINLARFSRPTALSAPSPSIVAALMNLVVLVPAFLLSTTALTELNDSLGYNKPSCTDHDDGRIQRCEELLGIFMVVLFVAYACLAVLGWVVIPGFIILWTTKTRVLYAQGESWRSWSIPSGQLSLEVTIKFLRQPPDGESRGVTST